MTEWCGIKVGGLYKATWQAERYPNPLLALSIRERITWGEGRMAEVTFLTDGIELKWTIPEGARPGWCGPLVEELAAPA